MDTDHTENFNIFSDYNNDSESNDVETRGGKKLRTNQINCKAENFEDSRKSAHNANETGSKQEELIETWSIEDDTLFFPMGISNYCIFGVDKFVVLTWSDFFLINFVIDKNMDSRKTKTTRARLNIPDGEKIKDVQILECNTLLLLQSGRVNFFSSLKSMHKLPWLDGVRCFSSTVQGFACVRLMEDEGLVLEMYEDIANMGRMATAPLRHRYNITFDDRNIFNCGWEDEHCELLTTPINEDNIIFLDHLTGHISDVKSKEEIHLFAISGNVFVLIADPQNDQDYNIEMIASYASNVAFMKVDSSRKFCLIFLQCGSIDVWFLSKKTHSVRRQFHYSGVEYISYTYSDASCSFYYSDGAQVVQLNFKYAPESDSVDVLESYKYIPGIYACTWVETIQCLVCLDCNNIFHQVTFDPVIGESIKKVNVDNKEIGMILTNPSDYEKFNTLYELTPNRVLDLAQKAHIIQQLRNMPQELYRSIDTEFTKQQLLAVAKKQRFYSNLSGARLEFSKGQPEEALKDTIPLNLDTSCKFGNCNFFAIVFVNAFVNEIFQSALWQIQLQYGSSYFAISVPSSMLKQCISLVIPLERVNAELLPSFRMDLYTSVSNGPDCLAIQIPIPIVINSNTYVRLFGPNVRKPEDVFFYNNLDKVLHRFKQHKKTAPPSEINHSLFLPRSIKLSLFFKEFQLANDSETDGKSFKINFLNSQITGHYDDEITLSLRSHDAVAIFYLKLFLQLFSKENQTAKNLLEDVDFQPILLRHQCAIENFYGTLTTPTEEMCSNADVNVGRFDTLIQLYNKMRKEVNQHIFM